MVRRAESGIHCAGGVRNVDPLIASKPLFTNFICHSRLGTASSRKKSCVCRAILLSSDIDVLDVVSARTETRDYGKDLSDLTNQTRFMKVLKFKERSKNLRMSPDQWCRLIEQYKRASRRE